MIIDITKVLTGVESKMSFTFEHNFTKEEIKDSDLLDLKDVHIKGNLSRPADDIYDFNMVVTGIMVLPCAITLKPVDYPFKTEVHDDLGVILDEIGLKMENRLDIFPIVWENVLMEIPSRVISPDARDYKAQGDGWKLVTDDDDEGNKALSGLKDLLEKKV